MDLPTLIQALGLGIEAVGAVLLAVGAERLTREALGKANASQLQSSIIRSVVFQSVAASRRSTRWGWVTFGAGLATQFAGLLLEASS